ncbi:MAG: hypothetical protein ACXV5Q_03205 [Frankiaceae bacterium]
MVKICASCEETFIAKRRDTIFCSAVCRQRAHQARLDARAETSAVRKLRPEPSPIPALSEDAALALVYSEKRVMRSEQRAAPLKAKPTARDLE